MEICAFLDPRFKDFSFLTGEEDKLAPKETFKAHALKMLKELDNDNDRSCEEPPAKRVKTEGRGLFEVLYGKHVVDSCEKTQTKKKLEIDSMQKWLDTWQNLK